MEFALSEEQAELAATVRQVLGKQADSAAVRAASTSESGYDPALWSTLCEQIGVAALAIPEEYDGAGATFFETAVVLEEIGRSLAPTPLLEVVALLPDPLGRLDVVADLRARRNQPGGYWIAKDDPRVAEQAVTGSVARSGLRGAALLSNGAARLVDPYGLEDWSGLLSVIRARGPDALLRRLRAAESERGLDEPDDATVAYCS